MTIQTIYNLWCGVGVSELHKIFTLETLCSGIFLKKTNEVVAQSTEITFCSYIVKHIHLAETAKVERLDSCCNTLLKTKWKSPVLALYSL